MNNAMKIATRTLLRWRILSMLYELRLTMSSSELLFNMLRTEFSASREDVKAELTYLESLKLVAVERSHHGAWCAQLRWRGTDLVEGTTACPDGIARPEQDAIPASRQHWCYMVRGRILHTLDVGRSFPVQETILAETVGERHAPLGRDQLRQELRYLASRKLLELDDKGAVWHAKLTPIGTDVGLGAIECFPGITVRPDCNRDL